MYSSRRPVQSKSKLDKTETHQPPATCPISACFSLSKIKFDKVGVPPHNRVVLEACQTRVPEMVVPDAFPHHRGVV